jgi:hypothetical protein
MMWARMDNHDKYREPPSDDTQSSTSSTSQNGRFSVRRLAFSGCSPL